MSATLAHEIKNPIAGIRSGIQVLKGRVERPGDQMLCDSMIKEIDRVTSLITNLFTLSVKKDSRKEKVFLESHFLLRYRDSRLSGPTGTSCARSFTT